MKQPIQMDILEAIRLRDEGIEMAVNHADAFYRPDAFIWRDIAYDFLVKVSKWYAGVWQVEDIRKLAEDKNIPVPPDSRAWGGVIRRAAAAGLVEKVGVQSKASTICHRGFASLWQFK